MQDGAGRGIRGQSGCRSCWAAAEEAGSPGEQHGPADFLTLPGAIRAAGPHLEFNRAGEGRAGAFPSAGQRRWQENCQQRAWFRLCYLDPAFPKAKSTNSRE